MCSADLVTGFDGSVEMVPEYEGVVVSVVHDPVQLVDLEVVPEEPEDRRLGVYLSVDAGGLVFDFAVTHPGLGRDDDNVGAVVGDGHDQRVVG